MTTDTPTTPPAPSVEELIAEAKRRIVYLQLHYFPEPDSDTAKDIELFCRLADALSSTRTAAGPVGDGGFIYVASRASLPARGEMWRSLRASDVPINSTWIDEDGPKASRDLSGLWVRIAREVTTASRLILYVEPDDFPLKSALIEVGMALAAGVPVFVVAPGVVIEPRNMRPLGSWMLHPLVGVASTVAEAIAAPLPSPPSDRLTTRGEVTGEGQELCEDCPPPDYPTDKTRCDPCPRRVLVIAPPPTTRSSIRGN